MLPAATCALYAEDLDNDDDDDDDDVELWLIQAPTDVSYLHPFQVIFVRR